MNLQFTHGRKAEVIVNSKLHVLFRVDVTVSLPQGVPARRLDTRWR